MFNERVWPLFVLYDFFYTTFNAKYDNHQAAGGDSVLYVPGQNKERSEIVVVNTFENENK